MEENELLELGLTKEQALEIIKKYENNIPKTRFDKVNEEKKRLEGEILNRDKRIEELEGESIEDLKSQIETLQKDNKLKDKNHAADVEKLKINNAVELAILNANGKNATAIQSLLNMDEIKFDNDGKVIGIAEQLDALVKGEDSCFLFGVKEKSIPVGVTPVESGSGAGKVDTSKMTYSQIAEYMAQNPEAKL